MTGRASEAGVEEQRLGRSTILFGERRGRYPHSNALLVEGREETVLIDPSLAVRARPDLIAGVDRVLVSHAHEDHVVDAAGLDGVPWLVHELDAPSLRSLDGLMAAYGLDAYPAARDRFRRVVVDDFHYVARPDAVTYRDGDVLDLGGGVTITAVLAPGHTPGHCLFRIEPDGVLFLADVDLSSFGPYYGDAVSSLADFESTLALVRREPARRYLTSHHIGLLDGCDAFLERLDRYDAVIPDRERRLLAYLGEPRTMAEIVSHRFVYRPQDDVPLADPIERRSMTQHLDRLVAAGAVCEVEPERFVRT